MKETGFMKRYSDLISGSVLLILGVAIFIGSFSIKRLTVSLVGAAFLPQIVSVLIFAFSIPILVSGVRNLRADIVEVPDSPEEKTDINHSATWLTILLLIVYVALYKQIGFIVMSILYLFLQMVILAPKSRRNYLLFGIMAVGVPLIIYFSFIKIFYLMLPAGILN